MSVSLARTRSFCRLGELFYKPKKWQFPLLFPSIEVPNFVGILGKRNWVFFAWFQRCFHVCLATIFFNFELFQRAFSLEVNYAQNFKFGLHIIALVSSIWSLRSYNCIFSKFSSLEGKYNLVKHRIKFDPLPVSISSHLLAVIWKRACKGSIIERFWKTYSDQSQEWWKYHFSSVYRYFTEQIYNENKGNHSSTRDIVLIN